MKINRSIRYKKVLFKILEFFAQDKVSASENFLNELDERINDLINFPFKYRKSIYFDNENIRDMVYKGYTIVYRVDLERDKIDILRIFNKNKPPLS